ncbi:hypothetical protein ABID58_000007 [Bradyrhizobium sp. S3.2.6]|uniref:hypothetical protein n=1 Tax=Bradyrhizobium sp. S3.2.6 TaxID=3156428 RepID=UPI003390CA2A
MLKSTPISCGDRHQAPSIAPATVPRFAGEFASEPCAVQLDLPIDLGYRRSVPHVWLMACEARQAGLIAERMRSRQHAFVDGSDGRTAIGPADLILLSDPTISGFRAFGPVGVDPAHAMRSLSHALAEERGAILREPSRDVIGIFLGESGIISGTPALSSTRLHRLIASLRHSATKGLPEVREERSRAALAEVANDADPLLLALLELERIDALGSENNSAYDHWAKSFAGLRRMAQRPRHDRVTNTDQPDLFGLSSQPNKAHSSYRAGYRVFPIIAQRLTMADLEFPRSQPHSVVREELDLPSIPSAQVCEWIRGAPSRRVKPFVSLRAMQPSRYEFELSTGLDAEIAVSLGVGGKAGLKEGRYELRVFSSSCRITPTRLDRSIGEEALFHIETPRAGAGIVDIEFAMAYSSPIVIRSHLSRVP